METLTGEVLDLKDIKNEFGSYRDFKARFDDSLNRQAEAFVLTGYLIKRARDTDVLKESGYKDYNEFAAAEYGLDKSQVSRYIGINDRFSENGYSGRLQERYKNFGYTKLAVMLTLPAAVNEELTADYSKQEILTLKAEIDEEKKITDMEVMLEEKDDKQRVLTLPGRVLYQIGKDRPETYLQLFDAAINTTARETEAETDRAVTDGLIDALAPAGEGVISVRIPGEGKKLLIIKGPGQEPVITDVRSNTSESVPWNDFIISAESICRGDDPKESWKILYGEEFPEKKTEVAPVQPDSGEKQAPKKPGRVIVSKPQKPKKTVEDNSPAKGTQESTTRKEEEQNHDENMEVAPVQPDIPQKQTENSGDPATLADSGDVPGSADHAPAACTGDGSGQGNAADDTGPAKEPPAAALAENVEGQMEITDIPGCAPGNAAVAQKQAEAGGYLIALKDNLDKVYILTERGDYQGAEKWLEAVRGTIRTIRDMDQAQKE